MFIGKISRHIICCIITLGTVYIILKQFQISQISENFNSKFPIPKKTCVSKLPNNNFKKSYIKHEVNALLRLNKNFKCVCGKGFHFPKIVNFLDKNIEMTNCGNSLQNSYHKIHYIYDHETQINCIFENLVKSKIMHLDIQSKNICVDENNVISLIDFDMLHFLEDDIDACIDSKKLQKYWNDNTRQLKTTSLIKEVQHNYKHNLKQDRWRKAFFSSMV